MSKSKADQARLDAIGNLPCVCCLSMKVKQPSPTERHHLVDMGDREKSGGHQSTVAICGWHHRALPLVRSIYHSNKDMLAVYGPSMKYQGSKGEFERCFGSQRELLEMTNKLLDTSDMSHL